MAIYTVCVFPATVQPDEAIYSGDVLVFRAPESKGHVFLSDPFKTAIITCPGIYRPQIDASGKLAAKHVQQLERKLDLVLKLAACFGHDSIVLGAMGCGGESVLVYFFLASYIRNKHAMHCCSMAEPSGRGGSCVCSGLTERLLGVAASRGGLPQHRQSRHHETEQGVIKPVLLFTRPKW